MDREQLNNLSKKFKDKTNEELLDIVYLHSDEYISEVINLAKKELINRDIDENSEKGKTIISSFISNSISIPDEAPPEQDQEELETELEIDEDKYKKLIRDYELNENLPLGVVSGIGASIFSAFIWAFVTVVTEYQIGFMAIGVGFFVGYSIRYFGKGINNIFGVIGGILSFFGCILGNILSICAFISIEESISFWYVLSKLDLSITLGILISTFNVMDLLFYSIAIYEGYKFSFRKITEQELLSISNPVEINKP